MRKTLPDRRKSVTHKAKVGGQTCYLTCGHYDDGTLGEIFVDVCKHGTFARGALDAFAKCFSVALQCGADLQCMLLMLKGASFPPQDETYSSVVDWTVKVLEAEYGRSG